MGTAVAAAPLLAAGPPGWIAYAAIAVVTVGVAGVIYMSRPKAKPKTETKPKTDSLPCRTWSVRTHAQGTDIGGTTGSTIGAPPLLSTVPIAAITGAANAHATNAMLTERQRSIRAAAFSNALIWLSERPANGGFLGQKSFQVLGQKGGLRFDIDSFGPSNNFIY